MDSSEESVEGVEPPSAAGEHKEQGGDTGWKRGGEGEGGEGEEGKGEGGVSHGSSGEAIPRKIKSRTLLFESRFESGNLARAWQVGQTEYVLIEPC